MSPGLFGCIAVCFFLPFMNISCAGKTFVQLTGLELITGKDTGEQHYAGSLPVAVALGAAAAGIAVGFIKGRAGAVASGVLALVGVAALAWFRYLVDKSLTAKGGSAFGVEYLFGYWASFLLFLAAAAFNVGRFVAGAKPRRRPLPNK
jgi:hypothetical protein